MPTTAIATDTQNRSQTLRTADLQVTTERKQPFWPWPLPEAEPVDMARLRDMVDDDPIGMRELIDLYLTESGELMGDLRAAVQAGSVADTESIAHKLGGSSATCGMIGIVAPLRELERSGKAGRWPENLKLLLEAGRQHGRICNYLDAHVSKH